MITSTLLLIMSLYIHFLLEVRDYKVLYSLSDDLIWMVFSDTETDHIGIYSFNK